MSDDANGVTQWDDIEDDGVLDPSDTLDGDPAADPLDTGVAAAERWSGATRYGTTAAEQHAGEPLGRRLAEEEPDIDPYTDAGDDEDELLRRGYGSEQRAGRLVAADPSTDTDGPGNDDVGPDAVAWDAGIDGGGASAEEAAMHVVEDPDGPGDGPLR